MPTNKRYNVGIYGIDANNKIIAQLSGSDLDQQTFDDIIANKDNLELTFSHLTQKKRNYIRQVVVSIEETDETKSATAQRIANEQTEREARTQAGTESQTVETETTDQ